MILAILPGIKQVMTLSKASTGRGWLWQRVQKKNP